MPQDIERLIKGELNLTGLEWSIEPGKAHRKIWLAGRMIGILPLTSKRTRDVGRQVKNTVAQIRRRAREVKGDQLEA